MLTKCTKDTEHIFIHSFHAQNWTFSQPNNFASFFTHKITVLFLLNYACLGPPKELWFNFSKYMGVWNCVEGILQEIFIET
jgi:hypothetical protein